MLKSFRERLARLLHPGVKRQSYVTTSMPNMANNVVRLNPLVTLTIRAIEDKLREDFERRWGFAREKSRPDFTIYACEIFFWQEGDSIFAYFDRLHVMFPSNDRPGNHVWNSSQAGFVEIKKIVVPNDFDEGGNFASYDVAQVKIEGCENKSESV